MFTVFIHNQRLISHLLRNSVLSLLTVSSLIWIFKLFIKTVVWINYGIYVEIPILEIFPSIKIQTIGNGLDQPNGNNCDKTPKSNNQNGWNIFKWIVIIIDHDVDG